MLKILLLVEKTHDKSAFYKYVPADTAELVLKNNTLRWSSPVLFNDLFDVPRELAHGLTSSEIREAVVELHIDLLRNTPKDISIFNPAVKSLINAIKEANSENLVDQIEEDLRCSLTEEISESTNLEEFREHWRKQVQAMRILCLCESFDRTSMWFHYADRYSGAVIEFLCTEEVDTPWRIAEPIVYTDENHLVSTPKGWAKLMNMEKEKALKKIFDASVYTKSEDWAYEKEWRIASFKDTHESGSYSDYSFDGRSIGNLYLGPLINQKLRGKLISLSKRYPNMQVYEASIGVSRKMTFTSISGEQGR